MSNTSQSSWSTTAWIAAARYLMIQAVTGGLWWALLFVYPPSQTWFFPETTVEVLVAAIAVPDLVVFVGGSAAASIALYRDFAWHRVAVVVVAGGTWYATLLTWAMSISNNGPWIGAVMMSAAAVMNGVTIWFTTPDVDLSGLCRTSKPRSATACFVRTLIQAALFWGFFLFLVPWGLHLLERSADMPLWKTTNTTRIFAIVLFVLAGSLGITSGYVMAKLGRGTPVPLDAPSRLVVAGPYRFVRNPMAVAGLLQGLAVAIWLGSPLCVAYVIAGGFVWNAIVRPLEEQDLLDRFGDAYRNYCGKVRCWVPKR